MADTVSRGDAAPASGAEHPAPQRGRSSLAALWFGLLGAPAAWSVQTLVNLPVASHSCFPRLYPLGTPAIGATRGIVLAVSLVVAFSVLFATLCLIYWRVPNFAVPWRAVWPGAAGATLAIIIVDYGFPLYLTNVSTFAKFGTTFVFVVIVAVELIPGRSAA